MAEDPAQDTSMRSWKKRLLTLRRCKTEPPKKDVIVTNPQRETKPIHKRSISMKDLFKSKHQEPFKDPTLSDIRSQRDTRTIAALTLPAFNNDDIHSEESNTPRSGVRLTVQCMPEMASCQRSESPSASDDDDDEICEYDTTQNLQKQNIYQEFVIRPLVVDDYSPLLLRFLSTFDPVNSKKLTHSKFAEVLLERKRKRHFTLIAASSETGHIMCMGSLVVVDSIFGSNMATAIVDSIMIIPEYQESALFRKMLARLIEVAELIPDVVFIRLNIQGASNEILGLLHQHNYEKLGNGFEMRLNKSSSSVGFRKQS